MKTYKKRILTVMTAVVLLFSALTLGINAAWYEIGGGYNVAYFSTPYSTPSAEVYYNSRNSSYALTNGQIPNVTFAYVDIACEIDSCEEFVYWYDESYSVDGYAVAELHCYQMFETEFPIITFDSFHFYQTSDNITSNYIYMGTSS